MNLLISLVMPVFLRLLALIPLRVLRVLGALLGQLTWLANGESRRVTETNLAICFPELSDGERRALARQRLQQLADFGLELGAAWTWPQDRLLAAISEIHGMEHLHAAHGQGRGVIMLAPHLGNWEVLATLIYSHYPLTNLYTPPEDPRLDALIQGYRRRAGAVAPANVSGVKTLLKALKRGELAGILPDQVPSAESGEFAPFFGRPALTMTLVHNLVQRTGAKVVLSVVERIEHSGGFRAVLEPADEDIYAADLQVSLAALNRCVEKVASRSPAQYQWEYKRFKKQPDGSRPYNT